jgi:cation:H+ antiporter
MLVTLAIFIVSMAVLLKSADLFTDNIEVLGKRFNIPSFILGVTIVAAGTSLPELASSIMAMDGASEIVLGNVIGSNITNILLVIGFACLFLKKETNITWDLFHGDLTFIIASTIMLGIVLIDGIVTIPEAVLMITGYLIYILYNIDVNKKIDNNHKNEPVVFNYINIIQIIASIILVTVSADYLVNSAVGISQMIGVGSDVIALTLIAFGTSLPELVVSLMAVRRGNIELAIGNVTGSNIFNTFMVVGIPRLLGDLAITPTLFPETYIYLLIAVALFISVILDKKLHRFEGAILFLFYIFFLLALF